MSTSLLHSRADQYSTAKAYVFSDSVLCVGKISSYATWKSKFKWCSENNHFNDMNQSNRWTVDGVRVENIPGNHSVGIPREDSKIYSVNRSALEAGSSSCRCLMTLYGMQKETKNNVNTIHRQTLANSLAVIGLSCSLDQKRNCAGARVSVALRVRSCSYPRHIDCHHLHQMCVDEPKAMCSISCMPYIAHFPTSMDEVLFGSVWNTFSSTSDTDDVIRVRVAATCWNESLWYNGQKFLLIAAQRSIREALVSRC